MKKAIIAVILAMILASIWVLPVSAISLQGSWQGEWGSQWASTTLTDGTYLFVMNNDIPGNVTKIDVATMATLDRWDAPVGFGSPIGMAYNSVTGFLFVAGNGSDNADNEVIDKVQISDMTTVSTWSYPIYGATTSLATDGTYLYACMASNSTHRTMVYQITETTMTTNGTWTGSTTNDSSNIPHCRYFGVYLYVTYDNGSPKVAQVDTSTMTTALSYNGGDTVIAMTWDGTYLYILIDNVNVYLRRIDVTTMTLTGDYYEQVAPPAIPMGATGTNSYAYILYSTDDDPSLDMSIEKVVYASMTLGDTWNNSGYAVARGSPSLYNNYWENNQMSVSGSYLYVGNYDATTVNVTKVVTSTMDTTDTWAGRLGELSGDAVVSGGNYFYVSSWVQYRSNTYNASAEIDKIDSSTLTTVSSYFLPASNPFLSTWSHVKGMLYWNNYLYVALSSGGSSVSEVKKIDPATMTVVATWTGAVTEKDVTSLATDGTDLYVGNSSTPARICKVNFGTMTTTSTWVGAAGQNYCDDLVYDGTNLYIALGTSTAKVVKVVTSTMTTDSLWTGGLGDYAECIAYDSSNLYVGLDTYPGEVVKVVKSTMTTDTTFTAAVNHDEIYSITYASGKVFAGTFTVPMYLEQVQISDMTGTTAYTGLDTAYPTQDNTGEFKAIIVYSNNIYVVLESYPSSMLKLGLLIPTTTPPSTLPTPVTGGFDIAKVKYNQGGLVTSYTTGTATFINGSNAVTGSGTAWTSAMNGGYIKLDADGTFVQIANVTSVSSMTLTGAYVPAGGSGAYTMQYLSGGSSSEDTQQTNNLWTPFWQPFLQISAYVPGAADVPIILIALIIGTAALIFIVVWVLKHTQNQFLGLAVLVIGEAGLYALGIYQLWFVIITGIIGVALVVFERKPSL